MTLILKPVQAAARGILVRILRLPKEGLPVFILAALTILPAANTARCDSVKEAGGQIGEETPVFHPGSDLTQLDDGRLVLLSKKLVRRGRCDLARQILDIYSARSGRDSVLDWEAEVIEETCGRISGGPPHPQEKILEALPTRDGHLKMNAVQIFVFSSPDIDSLGDEIRALRSKGVDTLIVRAFQNQGDRPLISSLEIKEPGVYFETDEAPVAGDVISPIVDIAGPLGMKVFAWITTRRSDWLINRHPEWLEYKYDFTLGRSLPTRSLSIFQGGVREKLKALVGDLAATGVDGILFQDDLIMRFNEGFSNLASRLFLMETGMGVHPDDLFIPSGSPGKAPRFRPLFHEWCRWKSKELMAFQNELAGEARRINPSISIAANVYYESVLKPENGLAWYAQDVRQLLENGIDFLALMSYHRQIKSELSLNDEQLNAILEQVVGRAKELSIDESRIIFKIQTTDWENIEVIPDHEWEAVRDFFREAGNFSIALLQS